MRERPFVIKASVYLLALYGLLEIIANFIFSFFMSSSGFFGLFGKSEGFNVYNLSSFIITSIPGIILILAASKVWKLTRFSYELSVILFVLSLTTILGGLLYFLNTLPKLFTEYAFLFGNGENMGFYVKGSELQTNSLFAARILIAKSLLKSVVEIIGPVFLFLTITRYKFYFGSSKK